MPLNATLAFLRSEESVQNRAKKKQTVEFARFLCLVCFLKHEEFFRQDQHAADKFISVYLNLFFYWRMVYLGVHSFNLFLG